MHMDKRYWYQVWKKVRPIRPWYFLLAACVTGSVGVMALRANNLHMADLRAAVYAADQNSGDVQSALQSLQVYVTSHMNTDLSTGPNAPYPPIQLQYTYDRAVRKAGEQATAANAQIYTDAQHYCEQQDPVDFSGRNRVPCVQQYIANHSVALSSIPDSLYKFDFVSPIWSSDLAGWSLALTSVMLLAGVGLWIIQRVVRRRSE